MQLPHRIAPARGALMAGLVLAALVALPPAARADDNNDWDWKTSSGKDKATWQTQDDGNGGWVSKDDEGNIRVYRVRRSGDDAAAGGGYLGVQVQDVTRALQRAKDLETSEGALVNQVEDGSPADDAGIQRGDVIIAVNGKGIGDSQELIQVIRDLKPGDAARVQVERDGARKTIEVKLGERPRRAMGMVPRGFGRGNWQFRGGDDDSDGPPNPPSPPMMFQYHQQNMDELNRQLEDLQKQIDQLNDELRGLREDLDRLNSDRTRVRGRNDRDDSGD